MILKNYDELVETNHNWNGAHIPNHPYRILIIADSRPGKTNALVNLKKHPRPDIDKTYLHVNSLSPKEKKQWSISIYQFFTNDWGFLGKFRIAMI